MIDLKEIYAHSIGYEEVANKMQTSIESGLTEKEVQIRIEKYGKNELIKEKGKTAWQIFISQFKDFLIYLLMFAIVISVIIGLYESSRPGGEAWSSEYTDAIVIAAILIVNAILGFYQEYQAERALESLKKLAPHFAKVRRDGRVTEINVDDVVPGDIVLFEEGDKFPADLRLFK
ncbi:MAG: cation-transporting P-type ATPase, partial [Promethearchaeota archaeon]